jgi:hypothetical protein
MSDSETSFPRRDGSHGDPARLEVVGETAPPGRIGRHLEQFGVHALVCPLAELWGGRGSEGQRPRPRFAFLLLFRGLSGNGILFRRGRCWRWSSGGRRGLEERCVRRYPAQCGTARMVSIVIVIIIIILLWIFGRVPQVEPRKAIELSSGIDLQGSPLG